MQEGSQEDPTQSLDRGRREKCLVSYNRRLSSEKTFIRIISLYRMGMQNVALEMDYTCNGTNGTGQSGPLTVIPFPVWHSASPTGTNCMCDRHFEPWLHVPQGRLPFPMGDKTPGEMYLHILSSSPCICNIDSHCIEQKTDVHVELLGCSLPWIIKYFLHGSPDFLITRTLADPFSNSVSH